jgi:hypothetical protein
MTSPLWRISMLDVVCNPVRNVKCWTGKFSMLDGEVLNAGRGLQPRP